ncbi:MAG: hypothetical protein ISR65_14630 [Bacteriovoracaceae bacterium]|nr:hypothetical protein [Bacteriovoracaceae bacterium]
MPVLIALYLLFFPMHALSNIKEVTPISPIDNKSRFEIEMHFLETASRDNSRYRKVQASKKEKEQKAAANDLQANDPNDLKEEKAPLVRSN